MSKNTVLDAIHATTVMDLVNQANRRNVAKEDIVWVLAVNDGYLMLYYTQQS